MATSDPIADMLTKIRNANQAKHSSLYVQYSNIKFNIIDLLKEHGFIKGYRVKEEEKKKFIHIDLKYTERDENIILGIKRISTPGRRHYVQTDNIPKVQNGLGISILSTSKGIMSDKDARFHKIGGEVICYVW